MKNIVKKQMPNILTKTKTTDVLGRFFVYLLIGLVGAVVVFCLIARLEYDRVNLIIANQERSNLRQLQFILRHDLEMIATDLLVIAASDSLSSYLDAPSWANRDDLNTRFRSFAKDKRLYEQIRYLDQHGQEIIRINMSGDIAEVVPLENLQNKQNRYYWQETMLLGQGEIYVSPLDLNIENGQIQIPYLPIFRVATPVFNGAGEKKGIVLLNYRAKHLLGRFSELFPDLDDGRFTVVNKDGYWLKADRPEKEWGFMLNRDANLAQELPDLWSDIQSKQSGQLLTAGGLFTFETLFPARDIEKTAGGKTDIEVDNEEKNRQDNPVWHLLTCIPLSQLSYLQFLRQYAHLFWVIPLGLAVYAVGSLHLAIIRTQKEMSDRSLKLLSTAIEQSPAAAVITDIAGNIQYVNPKFERMSGYERSELIGNKPRIFKSGETPPEVYEDLWKTILAGYEWIGEFENRRKDSSCYNVSAKITPIFHDSGEICSFLAIQEDVTEIRKLQRQLEQMATIDGLTGSYNRSYFLNLFNQEFRRAERYGQSLCLLVFDLDHFKSINDTFGHQAGDRVLANFARVVSSALRDSDLFGRLGGEEFGVVLIQTDREGANLLAERLRVEIEKMRVQYEGHDIRLTVSVGGTIWDRDDREIETILKRADIALYEAKRIGRNRVCFSYAKNGET